MGYIAKTKDEDFKKLRSLRSESLANEVMSNFEKISENMVINEHDDKILEILISTSLKVMASFEYIQHLEKEIDLKDNTIKELMRSM